jgi:hypothetical protein
VDGLTKTLPQQNAPMLVTTIKRFFLGVVLLLSAGGCVNTERGSRHVPPTETDSPDPRFAVGELLIRDDFSGDIGRWRVEAEKEGTVRASGGALEIDVPGGCTVWLKEELTGPVLISYEATAIDAGGPNDRVSDLNCFWMAQDARSPGDLFATQRSGVFSDYDQLRCYYVGHGGNSNTTTRFRRYIGEKGNRPLIPEHDLSAREFLLSANLPRKIQLIAAGPSVAYFSDGRRFFAVEDPMPYTTGWFGFRTVTSHLKIKNFTVHRLVRHDGTSIADVSN